MSAHWPRRVSLHISEGADGVAHAMVAVGNEGDQRLSYYQLSSQLGDLRGPQLQARALLQAARELALYVEQFKALP